MRDVAGLYATDKAKTLLMFKKGYWFFPGGKCEEGESLYAALARELHEELGMVLAGLPACLHTGTFSSPERVSYRYHTFLCAHNLLRGTPRLRLGDSVKDWVWVDAPWELNLTEHCRYIIETFGR
jgi:8-oxo-dGTP pyrophosphatase MutT (NUDIX family)